jgi:TonB-dependent receptor|tara:strand:- start:2138 stop:4855 length:2718 start_codon:yes stop_codon:yes gene_type:complete
MNKKIVFVALLISLIANAQDRGTVKGLLTDKEYNNDPLPFANVQLKGTTIGTTTDFDGLYTLSLDPGDHTIVFSFLGYKKIEKKFIITSGETIIIDQLMSAEEGVALDEIIIKSSTNKEKASVLILEQKKAIAIKTVLGAQELSIKGISDAGAAVTKTTGVSKGVKNIIVRGLGDRYNSTTFNGLPLPSEDPEYKNISLAFFETSIIKNIGVNKVFTSANGGDVGGANIDIVSKELTKRKEGNISLGLGINSQTVSKNFLMIDGTNKFGTQKLNHSITDFGVYNFQNSFNPNSQNFQLNKSISFKYGKKYAVGEDNTFSFFLVGSSNGSYNYQEGNIKQNTNGGLVFKDQEFSKYAYTVSQLLMGTIKYKATNFSLAYNHLFIHNNKQAIGDYLGKDDPQQEGDLSFQRRQQTNNNELYVNQLIGNYTIYERLNLETKGALNFIRGTEPDRRSNEYLIRNGETRPNTNSDGTNERYFSKLQENDYAAKGKLTYKLKENQDDKSTLDFGVDYRYTERLFAATIFNHRFTGNGAIIDIENPDAVFNQDGIDTNIFSLTSLNVKASNPNVIVPFTYRGKRLVSGAFTNIAYQFSDHLFISGGLKFEKSEQRVTYATNIGKSTVDGPSTINKSYILPSINVKYMMNEDNIIRFAASQTYTYPQFKETAPFKYQDINFASQGYPDLNPSDNYNVDAKYEHYFSSNELITVTGFYKYILNPISRSEISSAGNTLTYLNVGDNASIFGIELEARKNILKSGDTAENEYSLNVGINASYLNSKVNLDSNSIAQFQQASSELEGATPFLMNADLSFNKKYKNNEFRSTIVLNYFSDRVFSIGTRGFENIIEKGIPTLDLVSSYQLNKKYRFNLKATNLLNPSFQLSRNTASGSTVMLSNYKKGVTLSLSVSYDF